MTNPNILIFGAGKIGRSFIGQLFGRNGYEVIFVDIDQALVDALNRRKEYPVVSKGAESEERIIVRGVSAIHTKNRHIVVQAIADTSILAISTGKNALPVIAGIVADGLIEREKKYRGRSLDIILAENMRSADVYFKEKLREALPPSYPLEKQVGLVETSIGKMVPIMTDADLEADPLQVFAEPYNTLILDRHGFKGEIPRIPEMALKENMKAWVDRKVFIHNLGHATAAYVGHVKEPSAIFLCEVLDDPDIFNFTREVMQESGAVLMALYPGEFRKDQLNEHIDDLLSRFKNHKLGDTIFRVGSDLQRKLGADDRFMAPIRMAIRTGHSYSLIIKAMSMGFFFKAVDEKGRMFPGDEAFHALWKQYPDRLLNEICGLDPARDAAIIQNLKNLVHRS